MRYGTAQTSTNMLIWRCPQVQHVWGRLHARSRGDAEKGGMLRSSEELLADMRELSEPYSAYPCTDWR